MLSVDLTFPVTFSGGKGFFHKMYMNVMQTRTLNDRSVLRLVQIALAEDIGAGDITSEALIGQDDMGRATLLAKQSGIVAGTVVAGLVFGEVDRALTCEWDVTEGERIERGHVLGHVHGSLRSILTAERTALNFLQRMSGVATLTRRYVDEVSGTGATILDTRKTIPGWRIIDKYAVTMGGGMNHRMGLDDMIMIKDNHIAAHGSIAGAIGAVNRYLSDREIDSMPVVVETKNLNEVSETLSCEGVTRIMFDNFPVELMAEAVVLVDNRCATEASGGITFDTIRQVAATGVNYISIGALTHSATALDISLDLPV
jgi:nicotinate-nucleotide pyrophosphorylase (carboxylating)